MYSSTSHGRAKAVRPARAYIKQLCAHTGCSLEDLSEAIDNRVLWRERLRNIRAHSETWWLWYIYIYIYIYIYWGCITFFIDILCKSIYAQIRSCTAMCFSICVFQCVYVYVCVRVLVSICSFVPRNIFPNKSYWSISFKRNTHWEKYPQTC